MLARQLHCTVREAQRRVTVPEFNEWRGFNRIYPPLENRIDVLISATSGIVPDYAKGFREPEEFIDDDERTAAEINAAMRAMGKPK